MDDIKPVAWVLPGDDKERDGGWLDARIDDEGEFTKPLYDESAILQAKEEGRREGLREAAEIVLNGRFLHDKAPTKLFATEAATAITRAAEGK